MSPTEEPQANEIVEPIEARVENVWAKRERPARLSPEPLLRFVVDLPCREAAEMLGVNPGTMVKWRAGDFSPGLHYAKADRIAIRHLNTHPSMIWGAQWWQL